MIPPINYETLQQGIFLCNMKLKLCDSEIMKIKYHRMREKFKYLAEYNKAFEDALKEGASKIKKK